MASPLIPFFFSGGGRFALYRMLIHGYVYDVCMWVVGLVKLKHRPSMKLSERRNFKVQTLRKDLLWSTCRRRKMVRNRRKWAVEHFSVGNR